MYINSEKYVVMGKVLRGGLYHHCFVSKRSILEDEFSVPVMTDNIGDALILTDGDEAFHALWMLTPEWWQICDVYRLEYAFREVNE